MCWFILRVALCNHHEPQLLAGPFCNAIFHQLQRIQDPASWEDTSSPNALVPFEWNPETCEPNVDNTTVVSMWCGWECRNSYDPFGAIESMGMGWNLDAPAGGGPPMMGIEGGGLGEHGATFGEPRLGVGWREETLEGARASG